MVAQALVVEQHARDDERPGERPTPRLVGPGDEPRAERAVEPEQLLAGLAALAEARADDSPASRAAPCSTRAEFAKKLRLAELADASLLADLAAQVVELRAVDVADLHDLDLVDLRRVQRERPLDADAERVLADGERLAGPAPWRLITIPSNTWIRWRAPSMTRKWTRTVSPALKRGTSRS